MSSRVKLRGDYDIWRRQELRDALKSADLSGNITIDLTETTLLDAGSAAMLIALRRRLLEHTPQARMILLNAPAIVKRVLSLCGGYDLFDFTSDR